MKVTIERMIAPAWYDYLFGTLWRWSASKQLGLYAGFVAAGLAYTEKGARRKAHRAARQILDNEVIEYTYNPEGLL